MGTHPQYFTVEEVAEKFSVTTQTVHNWIKDRRLFAVRLSDRVVRIPRKAVESFAMESYSDALVDALGQPGEVREQLQKFEAKFHLTSVEFFRRWCEGEFEEDDPAYGQWALLIDFSRRSQARRSPEQSVVSNP